MTLGELLTADNLTGVVDIKLKRMQVLSLCQRVLAHAKDQNEESQREAKAVVVEIGVSCPWVIDTLKAFQTLYPKMQVYMQSGLSVEDFLNDHGVDTTNFGFFWGGKAQAKDENNNRGG